MIRDAAIVTDRLVLRLPEPGDRAAHHATWADPRVMAMLGPVMSSETADATLAKHDAYRAEGLGFRTVALRASGKVIGFCGLKRGEPHAPIHEEIEAGWIIAAEHWGQGYAREAMQALLAWGWRHCDAEHIFAITSAINARSRALMERLGMAWLPERDFDSVLYAPGDPLRASVTYAMERPR